MTSRSLLLAAIATLGVGTLVLPSSLLAQPASTQPAGEVAEARDFFEGIAKDVGLTGAALEKFRAGVEDGKKRVADWATTEGGKKLEELRKAAAEARRAKDSAKVKELTEQIRPLLKELSDLRIKVRAEALGSLTPEQQSTFIALQLERRVSRTLAPAKLTADQKAKVKSLAEAAAPGFLKEHPLSEDPYFRTLIGEQTKIVRQMMETELTPAQKKALGESRRAPAAATTEPAA